MRNPVELMIVFYQEFMRNGGDAAEALRHKPVSGNASTP